MVHGMSSGHELVVCILCAQEKSPVDGTVVCPVFTGTLLVLLLDIEQVADFWDFVQFLEVFLVCCERFLYHIYIHKYCNISNNFPVCIFPLLKFLSIVNQLLVLLRVLWFNYQ